MNPDDNGMRFILEQVSRQYQDLKVDLRTEVAVLRKDLTREFQRQDTERKALKDEIDARHSLTDERLTDIQEFRWKTIGALLLLITIGEIAIQVIMHAIST